jgi:hypothetical protein
LTSIVDAYANEKLNRAVGFHIRRTDNKVSIRNSPDHLFVAEAERVIDEGRQVFLATDNTVTEAMMIRRFGGRILVFPRRKVLAQRWPRPDFDLAALDDDLCDLLLLARTEYVIGSHYSSYSGLAIALNGSPLCRKLVLPDTCQAA